MELGDEYINECPYCGSKNLKTWGPAPLGSEKNPYELTEWTYSCRKCNKTFCVIKDRISYLE